MAFLTKEGLSTISLTSSTVFGRGTQLLLFDLCMAATSVTYFEVPFPYSGPNTHISLLWINLILQQ